MLTSTRHQRVIKLIITFELLTVLPTRRVVEMVGAWGSSPGDER